MVMTTCPNADASAKARLASIDPDKPVLVSVGAVWRTAAVGSGGVGAAPDQAPVGRRTGA